jgi:hypothetical protein
MPRATQLKSQAKLSPEKPATAKAGAAKDKAKKKPVPKR